MKIAILYIATKRYVELWDDFHNSAETYFLPNIQKDYFIFTDQPDKFDSSKYRVITIQDEKEWFEVSLNRFKYFLLAKEEILQYDYSFFFNANIVFNRIIEPIEVLPTEEDDWLIGTELTLPKRWCGSMIGGKSDVFMDVCTECYSMIEKDKERGVWRPNHDEYYYQSVLSNKNPLVITIVNNDDNSNSPILMRDKIKIFGDWMAELKDPKRNIKYILNYANRFFKSKSWKSVEGSSKDICKDLFGMERIKQLLSTDK